MHAPEAGAGSAGLDRRGTGLELEHWDRSGSHDLVAVGNHRDEEQIKEQAWFERESP
jgi:hypothetical protein